MFSTISRELLPLLAALGQTYQLQSIEKALEQFSSQILGIAAGIDLWWQGIEQSLLREEVDEVTKNWLLTCLLPEVYWLSLVSKTKNPTLKEIYQRASQQARQQLLAHPWTGSLKQKEVDRWRDWSTLMVAKFQRTTSAIEGRNGYLSRLHHSGRGLSEKDLQVLSVIHNERPSSSRWLYRSSTILWQNFSPSIFVGFWPNGRFTCFEKVQKIRRC